MYKLQKEINPTDFNHLGDVFICLFKQLELNLKKKNQNTLHPSMKRQL